MDVYEKAHDPVNGNRVAYCNTAKTGAHELLHNMGLTNNSGGIMTWQPSVRNNGRWEYPDQLVTSTNCFEADIRSGWPDYDVNGDPLGETPILLDLGGRPGVWTTGLEDPVYFDLDADGVPEWTTWSIAGRSQGFLAIDLNDNDVIDDGSELFGSASALHGGVTVGHGFAALAEYDRSRNGGNEDGLLDEADAVWSELRVWMDENHDAVTQRHELRKLGKFRIVALELDWYAVGNAHDPNMNRLRGHFHRRTRSDHGWVVTREVMEDVFLQEVKR